MLLLGISCSNEDTFPVSEQPQELEIMLDAGSFRTVETRAGGAAPDTELKNVTARTISAGGKVLQDKISITGLRRDGNTTYRGFMTVNDPSQVSRICILANCFPAGEQPAVVAGNVQTAFTPCTASGLTGGIPMWGVAAWSKGTSLSARLTRGVVAAKFVSEVKRQTFQLKKISLYQAADKVNICSSDWTEKATQAEPAGSAELRETEEYEVYFPEFKEMEDKSKRTCFVLEAVYKGSTTFYRIDFYKNGDYFLPECNSRYIFHILEVSQQGYDSPQEALENVGANVQKKILIDIEDNSNEVTTDGTYRFSFGPINTAVLNPKHFLITAFETDNESPVTVEQMETGKNWLSNLKIEKRGSMQKRVTDPDGTKRNITVYQWEVYGDFSQCKQLKTDSPVWGRRTQQIKIKCGRFEKKIGATQSLMPLVFANYKEYVKENGKKEVEVNTLEFDLMDPDKVDERYYRGQDLRPKNHRLRIWIKWDACSAGQRLESTELNIHIKVMKRNTAGAEPYTITETAKIVRSFDRNRAGKAYFDVEMPQVEDSRNWCKNWIEITASMESSVDTRLYVEQRYIQDEDNYIPYSVFL